MTAVQTDAYIQKQGRTYKRMNLAQRVELRRHYVEQIPRWRRPVTGYIIMFPLVGVILICALYLQQLFGTAFFPGTLLILSVLFTALFWGVGPALCALVLSTCALDYFFVPPFFSRMIHHWSEVAQLPTLVTENWHTDLQMLPYIFSGLTIALITAQRERARLRAVATEYDLKMYAQELETLNRKLEDANQTKDHFLSVASHELKTPVTTIRGQAQLMLRRISKQKKATTEVEGVEIALERINDQTGRLTMLIDELLDVSSMRAGKVQLHLRMTDIRHLCREAVDDNRLSSGRTILLDVPPEPVKMEVDCDRLSQVLVNLLSNAVKYSPEDKPVHVRVKEQNKHVIIEVQDQGSGIAEAQRERIFESFYRTPDAQSSSARGLGLGLAISKDIVELHGGRIWCESEVGKGSTFCVELPA